jgi:hypothetical protein
VLLLSEDNPVVNLVILENPVSKHIPETSGGGSVPFRKRTHQQSCLDRLKLVRDTSPSPTGTTDYSLNK